MLQTLFRIFRFLIPLLYLGVDEGGGGGDDKGKDTDKGGDPNEGFKNLLKRHENDARATAQLLYQENHQYREEIRGLEKELDRVRKQLPAEGTIILSKEDGELWQKYQALGKPEELEGVKAENATIKRGQLLSQVAEAHKYKVGVLQTLAGDLAFELREVDENGHKRKVAFVKVDGQDKALPDYAKEKWGDFLPSLEAKPEQQQQPVGNQTRRPAPVQSNQQPQQDNGQRSIVRF